MTNVPDDLREMWADVYRLFDSHYTMPNTAEAWTEFWIHAMAIQRKYNNPRLFQMILAASEMLEDHMKPPEPQNPCTYEDMKLF